MMNSKHLHTIKFRVLKTSIAVAACALIVTLVFGLVGIWLYSGKTTPAKLEVMRKAGLPVAKMGTTYVFAADVNGFSKLASVLAKQGTTANQALQLRAVASGKVNTASEEVREVASVLERDNAYGEAVKLAGRDTVRDTLVVNYILAYKLKMWYASNGQEPDLDKRVQSVEAALNAGRSFADLAARYSDDTATKWFAGDTGYLEVDALVPEYRTQIVNLEKHKRTRVYTRYGVHIVELLDSRTKDGKQLVRLQEIVLQPKNYDSWLLQQERALPVVWYIR